MGDAMYAVPEYSNPFSSEGLSSILVSNSDYVVTIIRDLNILKDVLTDKLELPMLFLSDLSDDELELYCDVNFWKAYKKVKAGKDIVDMELAGLKKAIGL